jgi:hypothetical protein
MIGNPPPETPDAVVAFPQSETSRHRGRGMTLRDYFAAKVIAGAVMHCGTGFVGENAADYAAAAYTIADAMIAARERKP